MTVPRVSAGIAALFLIVLLAAWHRFATDLEPNLCIETGGHPRFDQHVLPLQQSFLSQLAARTWQYRLFRFFEHGFENMFESAESVLLFIPGNAGSHGQCRDLFRVILKQNRESVAARTAFYALEFGEELTAFHGQTIMRQASYVRTVLTHLQSEHRQPRIYLIGHSMGGIVARLVAGSSSSDFGVHGVFTLGTPHSGPPVFLERSIYSIVNALNSEFPPVPFASIAGGTRDTLIGAHLVDSPHFPALVTSQINGLFLPTDHLCIMWCDQLLSKIAFFFGRVLAGDGPPTVDWPHPEKEQQQQQQQDFLSLFAATFSESTKSNILPPTFVAGRSVAVKDGPTRSISVALAAPSTASPTACAMRFLVQQRDHSPVEGDSFLFLVVHGCRSCLVAVEADASDSFLFELPFHSTTDKAVGPSHAFLSRLLQPEAAATETAFCLRIVSPPPVAAVDVSYGVSSVHMRVPESLRRDPIYVSVHSEHRQQALQEQEQEDQIRVSFPPILLALPGQARVLSQEWHSSKLPYVPVSSSMHHDEFVLLVDGGQADGSIVLHLPGFLDRLVHFIRLGNAFSVAGFAVFWAFIFASELSLVLVGPPVFLLGATLASGLDLFQLLVGLATFSACYVLHAVFSSAALGGALKAANLTLRGSLRLVAVGAALAVEWRLAFFFCAAWSCLTTAVPSRRLLYAMLAACGLLRPGIAVLATPEVWAAATARFWSLPAAPGLRRQKTEAVSLVVLGVVVLVVSTPVYIFRIMDACAVGMPCFCLVVVVLEWYFDAGTA